MKFKSAWAISAVGAAFALCLPVTAATASVPAEPSNQNPTVSMVSPETADPTGDPDDQDGPDQDGSTPSPTDSPEARTAPPYKFQTFADHAHAKDKTATLREVSVHGWWEYKDPELAAAKANVTVKLQQYNVSKGKWETKKTESKIRKAKNAPGSQRTNARMDCKWKSRTARWRAVVDVDIIGMKDSPEVAHGDETTLNCKV
jgi:hypothetical protein